MDFIFLELESTCQFVFHKLSHGALMYGFSPTNIFKDEKKAGFQTVLASKAKSASTLSGLAGNMHKAMQIP